MQSSTFITVVTVFVVSLATTIAAGETFECTEKTTEITANEGFLSIKRGSTCGFFMKQETQFFVIQSDDLHLENQDTLTIEPMDTGESPKVITGLQEEGYLVVGTKHPKLTFKFDPSIKDDSTMTVKFSQDPQQAISGDRKRTLVIRNVDVEKNYNLKVTKSTSDHVYVEKVGDNKFGHLLITENGGLVPIEASIDKTYTLRISPALKDCSANHEIKKEDSVEIHEPNITMVGTKEYYTCVHIFTTTMTGRAHFDVSFANFSDMLDEADRLMIIDGKSQDLLVTRSKVNYYKSLSTDIIFKGQNLAVVYHSPQKIHRVSSQSVISVIAKSLGGIVDAYDYKFDMQPKGNALYSLQRPQNSSGNIALEFSKFTGATVKFYNHQNEYISLDTKMFSGIITFDPKDDVRVEFSTPATTSGTVIYKPGNKCSGTLFKPSGSISITNANMTCNWFLGAQSNELSVNVNDLEMGGSLEIYSLSRDQSAPLFVKKNMAPTEVLPPMLISHPVYLTIQLGSSQSSFDASVSPHTITQVSATSGPQTTLTSIGYPTSYKWIDFIDKYPIYGNKIVLSVADLDLRDGQKMFVDKTEVTDFPQDFTLQSNLTNVTIQGPISNDFRLHRGYKLVTTNFQKTIDADIKQNQITTPKNLTSLLLKIQGDPGKRISYDIAFKEIQGTQVDVFDSRSLAGRRANSNEEHTGSTTSNVLLVSLRSTKEGIYVPELLVKYSQVPCNSTAGDHPCDKSSRCVPVDKLCKGISYCADGSDLKLPCSNGPSPPPKEIRSGVSGVAVFFLAILMFTLGSLTALYGPDLYKSFETRYRSGQYTTFQSAE